jgi:hypothetical protein
MPPPRRLEEPNWHNARRRSWTMACSPASKTAKARQGKGLKHYRPMKYPEYSGVFLGVSASQRKHSKRHNVYRISITESH